MSQEPANNVARPQSDAAQPEVGAAHASRGTAPALVPLVYDPRMEGVLDILGRMGVVLERHDHAVGEDKRGQTLIENFVKLNPPKFEGSAKPAEAEKWIKELEKIFKVFLYSDEEKVNLVDYQIEGNALYWWHAMRPSVFLVGVEVSWSAFSIAFYDKYFSSVVKDRKLNEFMQLKQGSFTVEEYEAKFAELSSFAPTLVTDPVEKAKWFMKGLNMEVKKQLSVLGPCLTQRFIVGLNTLSR